MYRPSTRGAAQCIDFDSWHCRQQVEPLWSSYSSCVACGQFKVTEMNSLTNLSSTHIKDMPNSGHGTSVVSSGFFEECYFGFLLTKDDLAIQRSEERRVGKECVSPCSFGCSLNH